MILVIFAVVVVLGLLVGGLVLKYSVRLLQGFAPGYGKSVRGGVPCPAWPAS